MIPMEIIKKDRRLSKLMGSRASSRSVASSITFSEVDSTDFESLDDNDDGDDSQMDPFLGSFLSPRYDNQAVLPQRRQSTIQPPRPHNRLQQHHGADADAADIRPGKPQRRQSKAIGIVTPPTITKQILRSISLDSAPSRPTRQQSEEFEMSTTTATSLEPVPDYLQPALTDEIECRLQELAVQAETFRHIVQVEDRKYRRKNYPNCFIGSEAVDAMVKVGLVNTRTDAVELARQFQKYLGLFQHVTNGHVFKDKYLFYKFTTTTPATAKSHNNICSSEATSHSQVMIQGRKKQSSNNHSGSAWYSLRERETIIDEDEDNDSTTLEGTSAMW